MPPSQGMLVGMSDVLWSMACSQAHAHGPKADLRAHTCMQLGCMQVLESTGQEVHVHYSTSVHTSVHKCPPPKRSHDAEDGTRWHMDLCMPRRDPLHARELQRT